MFSAKKPEDPSIAQNDHELILAFASLTDEEADARCQRYSDEQLAATVKLLCSQEISARLNQLLKVFRDLPENDGKSDDGLRANIYFWENGSERKRAEGLKLLTEWTAKQLKFPHSERDPAQEAASEKLMSSLENQAKLYGQIQNANSRITVIHSRFSLELASRVLAQAKLQNQNWRCNIL